MKLMMHVLKRNHYLNIDNENIGPVDIMMKLKEEYNEVVDAIVAYEDDKRLINLKEIIRETFDLIQICVLILWRCNIKANTLDEPNLIPEINIEHKDKLMKRKWIIETGIEIDIKE